MAPDNIARVRDHFDKNTNTYIDRHLGSSIELFRRQNAFVRQHYSPARSPRRVLDIGSASSIWGDVFLEEFPETEIVLLDISLAGLQRCRPDPRKARVLGDATNLPFLTSASDFVNLGAVLHHLIDYRGLRETRTRIQQFLEALAPHVQEDGCISVREIYHESFGRAGVFSRILFFASTIRLPGVIHKLLLSVGIRSQGAGVCFLTRRDWLKVFSATGYRVVAAAEENWRIPFYRRIFGLRASGDIFFLLKRAT